jgi:hypothetical protein
MTTRQFPKVSLTEAEDIATARGWTEAIAKKARAQAVALSAISAEEANRFGFIYWLLVFLQEAEDRTQKEQAFCDRTDVEEEELD